MLDHRSLRAWQKARATTLAVHRHADRRWEPARASMLEQVRRSALSVQLNIAEGYASGPGARFRSHLTIAYSSAVETTDVLELLQDLEPATDLKEIITLSRETQALTLRLLHKLRQAKGKK
jgi:four helix bundle protein